jgi:hypothetical protein
VGLIPDRFPGERLITKIWKTLADNGVGGLLSPWQTKRLGRARTEVRRNDILVLAQARRDAAEIAAGRKSIDEAGRLVDVTRTLALPDDRSTEATEDTTSSLPSDTVRLLEHLRAIGTRREMDRAVNTAMIIAKAEEEAESIGDIPISEEPVDPDWFARWRVNAEDTQDEEMQRLWARILAGETREPGSFSLHTIDFMRRLSRLDAAQIEKLAPFASEREIFHGGELDKILRSKGLTMDVLLELQDLGVVGALGLQKQFRSQNPNHFDNNLRFRNKALVVTADDATKVITLPGHVVTNVGAEIMRLGKFEADLDYVLQVGRQIVGMGFKVQLADAVDRGRKLYRATNLQSLG